MQSVLVDTNIVSFNIKGDSRRHLYDSHLEDKQKVLSFMTYAELHRWVIKWHWRTNRLNHFDQYIEMNYRVYYATEPVCRKWAEVREQCRKIGRTIDSDDAWIAATALVLELPLITHNKKHFEHVDGLIVISEVEGQG